MSVQDFKIKYLPRVQNDKERDNLRAMIDLTVRLRVYWTSPDRPDDDEFSNHRGTKIPRMGTGFIYRVYKTVSDEPCPGDKCNGEITQKFWRLLVRTAHHVMYNTEEAKSTRVDLFYDDDSCKFDGRMVTVKGLEMVGINGDRDVSYMDCVTHDEALGERIKSLRMSLYSVRNRVDLDLSSPVFLPPCDAGPYPILIVSHPHGQHKKITLGQWTDGEFHLVEYNTATCPGSSGAPVFRLYRDPRHRRRYDLLISPVHSGSFSSTSTQHQDQLNIHTRYLQNLRGRESKQEQQNYGYLGLFD